MTKLKKLDFKINGLHCKSCKTLLETEVDVLGGVNNVDVNYQTGECWVEFDEDQIPFSKIKNKIEEFDYKVADFKDNNVHHAKNGKNNFLLGLLVPLILIGVVVGYLSLQRLGGFEILAKLNESNVSYSLLLLIGFLVSFHCVGMCGGLVVTYSAGLVAKNSDKKASLSLPHIQYNLGRLISYAVIGGILGGIGSFFAINPNFSGIVMLLAGGFMILMSIALFSNFKALENLVPKMPQIF